MSMPRHAERTSDRLLAILAANDAPRISVGELVAALGDRAFGIVLLLLALPNVFAGLPGVSSLTGAPMMIFAVQMILGHHRPWLPRMLSRRDFARADLRAVVTRAVPYLRRFERVCRPRIEILTRGLPERLVGGLVLLLAFVLFLPIPIPFVANMLPAAAVAVVAVGFIERDGLAVTVGVVLGVAALAFTLAGALAAVLLVIGVVSGLLR